jgi:hypothetical protein
MPIEELLESFGVHHNKPALPHRAWPVVCVRHGNGILMLWLFRMGERHEAYAAAAIDRVRDFL